MRENLPTMLRTAAKEWREKNKVVATGATRYDAALEEAADAIEELSKPKWIPVTERLPESQGPFLTRYGFGDASIETGQFFYGVLYYLYADADPHWQHESVGVEVTHWMPLPEPPKEE